MFDNIYQLFAAIDSELIWKVGELMVSLIAFWFIYRMARKYLLQIGKRFGIEEHTLNILQLLAKVVVVWFGTMMVIQVLGLSTDWFLGASALAGTAIGFGSSQTIGNFVAGLYILVSQPFTINDFVKIGDVEGQIEGITINYTMIYTRSRNLVKIPNTQILNSRILHCTKEGVIDYSFTLNCFDHSFTNERVIRNILEPAINEFCRKHRDRLVDTPKCYLIDADRTGKTFSIRLFLQKGDARSLYNLQPVLLRMILDRYYEERDKKPLKQS